jgi:hypothetical protein
MSLNSESKYPMRRTFVVKLRADATAAELAGRVENLVTGRQQAFASAGELIAAIAGELVSPDPDQIPTVR